MSELPEPPATGLGHGSTSTSAPVPVSAADRFQAIRTHIRSAEESLLSAGVLLAEAFDSREWRSLGFSSFGHYAAEAGIRQDVASKLVGIGRTFSEKGEPLWARLPSADQRELSVERLYIAARRVDAGQVDPTTALHDAIAHPPAWHRAMLKGTEPLDHHSCVCPTCGTRHWTT